MFGRAFLSQLQHVAEHGDAPRSGLQAENRERRADRRGRRIVAFIEQQGVAAGERDAAARAPSRNRDEAF